jgi:hypothetical protein
MLSTAKTIGNGPQDDLPEGVHSKSGVVYLARLAGWNGGDDHLPSVCIFDEEMGFSETTAFIKTSDGRGYYKTSMSECSCPDYRYRRGARGELCKHQKVLAERLERKARIDERNRRRAEERARSPKPSTSRGFNQPDEVTA